MTHSAARPADPTPLRPFVASDFEDPCEDCHAPPGSYCRPSCGSGFTADDARRQAGGSPHAH